MGYTLFLSQTNADFSKQENKDKIANINSLYRSFLTMIPADITKDRTPSAKGMEQIRSLSTYNGHYVSLADVLRANETFSTTELERLRDWNFVERLERGWAVVDGKKDFCKTDASRYDLAVCVCYSVYDIMFSGFFEGGSSNRKNITDTLRVILVLKDDYCTISDGVIVIGNRIREYAEELFGKAACNKMNAQYVAHESFVEGGGKKGDLFQEMARMAVETISA